MLRVKFILIISFHEFSELFLPKNPKDSKNMSCRVTSRINQISSQTKNLLIEFFEKLADSEIRIQNLRMAFNKEYELSPYEQFVKLKGVKTDFCDKSQIKNYLTKYDFIQSPVEIDIIFDRFDKDRDGKFYFSEVDLFSLFLNFFLLYINILDILNFSF